MKQMKQAYPTLIAQAGNDFLVYVPDMDIYTEGKSFVDAIDMARDAIALKCVDMSNDKKELPKPSGQEEAIRKAKADTEIFDYSQGTLTYVDVDLAKYRRKMERQSVRRNVTLPRWLDMEASKAGINVSRVLQKALMEELELQR